MHHVENSLFVLLISILLGCGNVRAPGTDPPTSAPTPAPPPNELPQCNGVAPGTVFSLPSGATLFDCTLVDGDYYVTSAPAVQEGDVVTLRYFTMRNATLHIALTNGTLVMDGFDIVGSADPPQQAAISTNSTLTIRANNVTASVSTFVFGFDASSTINDTTSSLEVRDSHISVASTACSIQPVASFVSTTMKLNLTVIDSTVTIESSQCAQQSASLISQVNASQGISTVAILNSTVELNSSSVATTLTAATAWVATLPSQPGLFPTVFTTTPSANSDAAALPFTPQFFVYQSTLSYAAPTVSVLSDAGLGMDLLDDWYSVVVWQSRVTLQGHGSMIQLTPSSPSPSRTVSRTPSVDDTRSASHTRSTATDATITCTRTRTPLVPPTFVGLFVRDVTPLIDFASRTNTSLVNRTAECQTSATPLSMIAACFNRFANPPCAATRAYIMPADLVNVPNGSIALTASSSFGLAVPTVRFTESRDSFATALLTFVNLTAWSLSNTGLATTAAAVQAAQSSSTSPLAVVVAFPPQCFAVALSARQREVLLAIPLAGPPPAPPPLVPQTVVTAVQSTVAASVTASGVTGSPTAASQAARSNFLLKLAACDPEFGPLGFSDSPTGVSLTDEDVRYLFGAVVMNLVLLVAWVAGNVGAGLLHTVARHKTVVEGLAWARFPSASVFPVMFLIQTETTSAIACVAFGSAMPAVVGGAIILLWFALIGVLAYFFAALFHQHATYESDAQWAELPALRRVFGRRGEWRALTPGFDINRHLASVFDDYGDAAPWFILVEIMMNVLLGGAAALTQVAGCPGTAYVAVGVYAVYLTLLVYFRPHCRLFDFAFTLVLAVAQGLVAGLIVIQLNGDKSASLANAINVVSTTTLLLMVLRSAYDVVITVREVCFRTFGRRRVAAPFFADASGDGAEALLALNLLAVDEALAPSSINGALVKERGNADDDIVALQSHDTNRSRRNSFAASAPGPAAYSLRSLAETTQGRRTGAPLTHNVLCDAFGSQHRAHEGGAVISAAQHADARTVEESSARVFDSGDPELDAFLEGLL